MGKNRLFVFCFHCLCNVYLLWIRPRPLLTVLLFLCECVQLIHIHIHSHVVYLLTYLLFNCALLNSTHFWHTLRSACPPLIQCSLASLIHSFRCSLRCTYTFHTHFDFKTAHIFYQDTCTKF